MDRNAIHAGCGGEVLASMVHFVTFRGIVTEDGFFRYETATKALEQVEKNGTGLFCNKCGDFVDLSEVEAGDALPRPVESPPF